MRLRSYLVDAQRAFTAYWWLPWIVTPTLFFGLGVYVVAEPLFGGGFAASLSKIYLVVGAPLVVVLVVGQLVWNVVVDEPDHLVD